MSSTDRQNRLLLAEDWKRIYQSFRNADFQSYDFDNLRRTMINYLRTNYPEDFNDYIESSEYLALIDLIAFLGQNLSFRVDLNARENYIELAERRESILRLARLLSYNPKRMQPSNGFLKISSVQTTEQVTDTNNFNLANQTILWNDSSNPNWREQFNLVLNSALPVNGTIGSPERRELINGLQTDQYRINGSSGDLPVYGFSKRVDGSNLQFEVTSCKINEGQIIEEPPLQGNQLSFIYTDDGKGAGSSNTGYFLHFRQGVLETETFTIERPIANQVVAIDVDNINDSDVWLYSVDDQGAEQKLWTKVDNVEGNNVIYNSVNKEVRDIYSVLTRVNDRINLIFSDGVFGNLPSGGFRAYYRTSENRSYNINAREMQNILISVPYVTKKGQAETITITASLRYNVDNASSRETNDSIRSSAPATYYTQNRMITAEDYNILPLAQSQEIVKIKSVNRTSSGISRYYDLIDATGKYSTTSLFASDGVMYKQESQQKTNFAFETQTDIEGVIVNQIEPILQNKNILNFYLSKFPKVLIKDLNATWTQVTSDTNRSTGYLSDVDGIRYFVSTFTANFLRLIEPGTLCKFVAPDGKHFMENGTIMDGEPDHPGSSLYKWVKVVSVVGRGTEVQDTGLGPIVLNDIIPSEAILTELRPKLSTVLTNDVRTQFIDQAFAYNTFGLRYDINERAWKIITESNLNLTDEFSTGQEGDSTNQKLDASWMLLFETNGDNYTVTYRSLRYVFESAKEIKFFYDDTDKVYDPKTGKLVKDTINILSINKAPDSREAFNDDFLWEISNSYRDAEGYVDTSKIEITFNDSDDDGVVDNPDIFDDIIAEDTNVLDKLVFLEKYTTTAQVDDYRYISLSDSNIIPLNTESEVGPYSSYNEGQIWYFRDVDTFKILRNLNLQVTADYKAFVGRDQLKFHYIHSADSNNRIDPSSTNIIDCYMLTRTYDTNYRNWLDDELTDKPLPPSSDDLYKSYGQKLNNLKSISDEIIYHPVKYKVLFGNKADPDLRAVFKVVKNPDLVVNDNDVRTRVISAINQYFALENWEFGETFYFSELATYIMNSLSPDIVSVVIVPNQDYLYFGSLYEIKSESDEIFVSGATVDNVTIIDTITAAKLKSAGNIVTSVASTTTGVQSGSSVSSGNGGNSY